MTVTNDAGLRACEVCRAVYIPRDHDDPLNCPDCGSFDTTAQFSVRSRGP
jgi:RNA polymerase subunit RPABC4/transcription elongation factor Spt4